MLPEYLKCSNCTLCGLKIQVNVSKAPNKCVLLLASTWLLAPSPPTHPKTRLASRQLQGKCRPFRHTPTSQQTATQETIFQASTRKLIPAVIALQPRLQHRNYLHDSGGLCQRSQGDSVTRQLGQSCETLAPIMNNNTNNIILGK